MNNGKPTVLAVEDEAAAALELLHQHDPDVALLDVPPGRSQVSDATGLAARKSRFIFVAGHTIQVLQHAHRHGPLVRKPFLPHVVLQAVQDALEDCSSLGEKVT